MTKTYSTWIEKQPNGKYKFVKRYVDPMRSRKGHIVTKKVSTTLTKKTAQAKREAEEILDKKIKDKLNEAAKGTDISLQELTDKYQDYLKETDRPWNTRVSAVSNLREANDYFKDAVAKNITTAQVNKYLYWCLYERKPTLANGSVEKRQAYLSSVFNFGMDYGYVSTNPVHGATVKKKDESKQKNNAIENKYLTDAELRAILGYEKYVHNRIDYYYFFKFLAMTGMRVSEAAGLTKQDFFMQNGYWFAKVVGNYQYKFGKLLKTDPSAKRNSKSNTVKTARSYRKVQLNQPCVDIFNKLKESRKDNDFLFMNMYHKPTPWRYTIVDQHLEHVMHKLGINKRVSVHLFRHTYISKLAEQHQPLIVIMRQVGQADSNVTKQIYMHVTEKERANLSQGLAKLNTDIGV